MEKLCGGRKKPAINTGFALVGCNANSNIYELINFGDGEQFSISTAPQRKLLNR